MEVMELKEVDIPPELAQDLLRTLLLATEQEGTGGETRMITRMTSWNGWTGLGLGIMIGLVLGVAAVLLPMGREIQ